jgi:hypothetical protein
MKYLQSKSVFEKHYLKRFNESVDNIDEIKQTIKDILLPISDMGYEIIITEDPTYFAQTGKFYIRVVTYTNPALTMNDEVKDEFIRMNDYLEDLGCRVKALYVPESASYHDYDYFHDPTEDYEAGRRDVPFNDFIEVEDCKLKNLLFVVKV